MIAIFSGTALTVFLALEWTCRISFNRCGILEKDVFH